MWKPESVTFPPLFLPSLPFPPPRPSALPSLLLSLLLPSLHTRCLSSLLLPSAKRLLFTRGKKSSDLSGPRSYILQQTALATPQGKSETTNSCREQPGQPLTRISTERNGQAVSRLQELYITTTHPPTHPNNDKQPPTG
ncbi:hypothetical protein B0O80DRAFT_5111 [Mortierella sp. GBAus27b]|nr:hypothetical protein B0O80DRAFT_5111 [Mortierella sp. GBAus27b]